MATQADIELIDTHCHIDNVRFDQDRDNVLAHCTSLGIKRLIVPGVSASNWKKISSLVHQHPMLSPAYGLHPLYTSTHNISDIEFLNEYLDMENPVAVGEIGLDFFVNRDDRDIQKEYFIQQLQIASDKRLPVILHARKSHNEILNCLNKYPVSGGICHAFNGSLQQAYNYINKGFKLGFGGAITFSNSNKLRKLAVELPLDAIVLETDSPDMSGAQHKGQRNSPEYLPEILNDLALIRKEPIEYIAEKQIL